ncbi:MAG: class I SAM-dependent methyltransferase [Polyangiaceae bacterium]
MTESKSEPAAAEAPAAPGAGAAHPPPVRPGSNLRQGMIGRISRRFRARAELALPAVPSLVPHYVEVLAEHFLALGRPFSAEELSGLSRVLLMKAREGFRQSPYSSIVVRYETADDGSLRINYAIAASVSTMASEYESWVATRKPPLFGASADARVLSALEGLPGPSVCLDLGAGTGRNALPMARRGHEVIAVEPAPALANVLREAASAEGLGVTVVEADALSGDLSSAEGRCALAVASQVTSHLRSKEELRGLFAAMARALAPGGVGLVTAFLVADGRRLDVAAREAAQALWSTFFTREDLASALHGLPLKLASSEDAIAYEKAHLPEGAWPLTGWFEEWASGVDVFGVQDDPPISLRWLVFERRAGTVPDAPGATRE